MPKFDFKLAEGCVIPQPNYEARINRTTGKFILDDDKLSLALRFRIRGLNQETEIFQGNFDFLIIFGHQSKDEISAMLEIEEIKKTFLGNQADKLVWSYFRRVVLQAVVDAGLPPIVLPLYK